MKPSVDVCMLLEGTYPFVRGGVSAWVHQLISGLPDVRFGLLFLGGRRSDYGAATYALPENVMHLEAHYLEDAFRGCRAANDSMSSERLERVCGLHAYLKASASGAVHDANLQDSVDAMLRDVEEPGGVTLDQFLSSRAAWDFIRGSYVSDAACTAFTDYFWTLRLMHGPVFQLARIARDAPQARAYHAISTGYAGLLGAFLERRRKRPLILSEHGIYTKERRIDLNQAEWFDALRGPQPSWARDDSAAIRKLWIRFFEGIGRLAYRSANPIISLYEGNRERQVRDGAEAARTRIVGNGIDVERFTQVLAARPARTPHVVGLIGRVVPIKDVKTFLRAMHGVIAALPDAEGVVVGSTDEDPAYAQECRALAHALGLEARVRFLGHQDVMDVLPRLGVVMLTSISEAQPLAVLEAFAAGVPCVTTDVGACREQIEGRMPEDRALGCAGRVVPFSDTDALARAAVELLADEAQWRACQAAGLARVRKYYAQAAMVDAYHQIYRQALEA